MERKEISTQNGLKQLPRGKHDVPEKMQEKWTVIKSKGDLDPEGRGHPDTGIKLMWSE